MTLHFKSITVAAVWRQVKRVGGGAQLGGERGTWGGWVRGFPLGGGRTRLESESVLKGDPVGWASGLHAEYMKQKSRISPRFSV